MSKTVHALWIGSKTLNNLELLTINSFISQGANFNLWTYEPLANVPRKVIVRDGNEMLNASMIFRYPSEMYLNIGNNSLVGFSELFRYKVLYELGGWWSDMDITCLKPLEEYKEEYYFRFHGILSVVGNIMKVPPKSELMKNCFDKAILEVNEKQKDWHHAIRILCYYIENLGLSKYIKYDTCNLDDPYVFYRNFLHREGSLDEIPSTWLFIHWMNSLNPKCEKNSILDLLYNKYNKKNILAMI